MPRVKSVAITIKETKMSIHNMYLLISLFYFRKDATEIIVKRLNLGRYGSPNERLSSYLHYFWLDIYLDIAGVEIISLVSDEGLYQPFA